MITIYSKKICPFCVMAKNLFNSLEIEFEEIDVTDDIETLQKISAKSGMRTVPQIFVWEKCLGGYSDVEALHKEWKLLAELEK